ncbi:unnamed protein product [Cylindrotheca closterium]|uniref:Pentacotripeptide-repeat region of PRORP domain-containing protein n=1 Tax=Cylindrotheca closterium TaxID=2856 RepID=A0AAD2CTQ3_9STRA|nr:unnamed protein product [Cylindrotheca closterium]
MKRQAVRIAKRVHPSRRTGRQASCIDFKPFSSTSTASSSYPNGADSDALSWNEVTKQFLNDTSSTSSSDLFRQAQAVVDLLVPEMDEDEYDEAQRNQRVSRKAALHRIQAESEQDISLAFEFLDRLLEIEEEEMQNGGRESISSYDDSKSKCLNAVLQMWREYQIKPRMETLSPDDVLQKLDRYRATSSLLVPDAHSYNILLGGAANRGDVEFCESLYHWMWEESKTDSLLRPDIATLRTIFKVYIQTSLQTGQTIESMGAPEACEALVDDWKKRSQSSSIRGVYDALIHVWAHFDPIQSEIYLKSLARQRVEKQGPGPDTVSWNRVISAYSILHDQPSKAAELLEEFWHYTQLLEEIGSMEGVSDARPDLVSYNSVLEGWARIRNTDETDKVFRRLQMSTSTSPNIVSYTSMIKANGSNWERVQELAEECIQAFREQASKQGDGDDSKGNLELDQPFFHAWLQSALECGEGKQTVQNVLAIIDVMKSLGLQPDTKCFLILLEGFLKHDDDIEGATRWFIENAKTTMDEDSIVSWVTQILVLVDDISIVPPLLQFRGRKSVSLLQTICQDELLTETKNMERLLSKLSAQQGMAMLGWMKGKPSCKAYAIVLRNVASNGKLSDAESIFSQWKQNYSLDSVALEDGALVAEMLTSLIIASSKGGNLLRCKDWIEVWRDQDGKLPKPDQRVQTAVLSTYAKVMDATGAQQYLRQLQQDGLEPDVVMYNIVLRALAKSSSAGHAHEFFEQAMADKDIISYNTIIHAHSKEGNLEEAKRLIEKMVAQYSKDREEHWSVRPDLATFRPLLLGTARFKGRDSGGNVEELLLWMERLHEEGVLVEPPDARCYEIALNAWSRSGTTEAAERAEDLMRSMMPLSSPSAYAMVMKAYKRNPGRKQALFDEMYGAYRQGNNNLKPTSEHFRLVLEELANTSPEQAESFLRRMGHLYEEEGLSSAKPTRQAYNTVLKSWARMSTNSKSTSWKCAEGLLRDLQSLYLQDGDPKLQPSMESYKPVLILLSKEKQVARLESLFDELFGAYCATASGPSATTASLEPDSTCVHSLLLAYRSTKNAQKTRDFLKQLEEWKDSNILNLDLSISTYNIALSCLASSTSSKKQTELRNVAQECETFLLQHMPSRGINPDLISFQAVLNAWARSRSSEAPSKIESLIQDNMIPSSIAPDHLTFSIWLRAIVKSGSGRDRRNEAEAVIRQMKENGFTPSERDMKLLSVVLAKD